MLLTAIQYLRDYYKCDMKYILEDNSSQIYNQQSKIKINNTELYLSIINILLFGKSLYTEYLNAQPYDEPYETPYNNSEINRLNILNNYLINNKDQFYKFFIKSYDEYRYFINHNTDKNYNNNEFLINKIISDDFMNNIISDDFMNIIKLNEINISKKHIWNFIRNKCKKADCSRDFLQSLYKKFGLSIFLILNYKEYSKYIGLKHMISLNILELMIIPDEIIKSINVYK